MISLVTGGGGFLGGEIVRRLLARGDSVRSFSRGDYPKLRQAGVDLRRGELFDQVAVSEAVKGCEIVFHVASKAGIWGDEQDYWRTNVEGTSNVISACLQHNVSRLVYTSTPSVVFNGRDMEGVDESVPYADHFLTAYPRTKAEAEKLILAANGQALATVALRPHLIWGPGDNHLIPRILARARAGSLLRIGHANKLVDSVYIEDAAEAHILAGDRLQIDSIVSGKVYFITQGEPVPLWDLVNRILRAANLAPVRRSVPASLAYLVGWIMETFQHLTRNANEPRMTRFLAQELSTAHWFNIAAARRDLGYAPSISIAEGMQRLAASLVDSKMN